MSLTNAMFTGVSGLLANANAINVIGNNIANVNTTGFKDSRTLFGDLLYSNIGPSSQVGSGTEIESVDKLFSQGTVLSSTVATDLAIQGDGFFALGAPGAVATVTPANALYTRAGSFRTDSTGLALVNPEGFTVLDSAGNPIVFAATYTPPGAGATAQNFQKVTGVDATGQIALLYADAAGNSSTVYYAGTGAAPVPAGGATVQIASTRIDNPQGLKAEGATLFSANAQSGVPAAFGTANGTTTEMLSNNLEQSNVDMASEFVNMITIQRAYSANAKTITTADEMTQEVLNLKR